MGRAHARAIHALQELDVPFRPELVSIARKSAGVDWRDQVADERIGLFVNAAPNSLHFEPTVAAVRAGKQVLCEKPLALSSAEAREMWQEADNAGVVHLCGFNYRFVPAVRLARELLEAGELGEVVHFRARYLQSWGWDADPALWRFDPGETGTGALGDLGTHVIDLARYLIGEIRSVSALVRAFVPGREVDDHFVSTVEFENGVAGTLEASRLARGRINSNVFEVNGSRGSLAFDLERLNELEVSDGSDFRRVLVTEPEHPFMRYWWPPGHIIGWGETVVHELAHLLEAIAGEHGVPPHGATFEDGYRAAEVVDAIVRSADTGNREEVSDRT
jgi:predicted dehydrogenase